MADSPLARLFAERKIRMRGDAHHPLLCAKDVAAYIADGGYKRYLGTIKLEKYVVSAVVPGGKLSARVKFFTEQGVYKYLLQSKRPKAEEFQEFVFELLTAERKRVVDELKLQAKIKEDECVLRNEVLRMENNELKVENTKLNAITGELAAVTSELKTANAALIVKNGELEAKTDEMKGSVQFYKQSLRQSDWLLTKKAPDLEEAFKRPDAYWTDLAKYYCKRANFEVERNFVPTDPAELEPELKRICWDCFADPSMHYDGYAIFLKKAQELHDLQPKRSNKPEKIYTIADVDPALYAANLKLIQADSARRRALLISRGAKLPPPPSDDDDYGGRWA